MKPRTLSLIATRVTLQSTPLKFAVCITRQRSSSTSRERYLTRIKGDEARGLNRRICGIWYIPDPANTDPSTVISKLPQLLLDARKIYTQAVILATPGLASWFEKSNPFLQSAMNHIYPTSSSTSSATTTASSPPISTTTELAKPGIKSKRIASYVGIVDALPAPESFTTNNWNEYRGPNSHGTVDRRPHAPAEGIAICLSPIVVWHASTPKPEDSKAVGSLEIASRPGILDGQQHVKSKLALPLANTLFVNGSKWTAFTNLWGHSKKKGDLVIYGERLALDTIQIPLDNAPRSIFNHRVPLIPLTKKRKVVSSMGNVVREVEGDEEGKPMRASVELEGAVPKFLKALEAQGGGQAHIQVFASVRPPSVESEQDGKEGQSLSENQSAESGKPEADLFTTMEEHLTYESLWGQGRLYRVMSGGGGWGKKAGLLSLDPAITLDRTVNTDSTGAFPDPDMEMDSLDPDTDLVKPAEVGALVPPGHTIQFFAVNIQEPRPPYYLQKEENELDEFTTKPYSTEEWSELDSKKFLFGVSLPDEGFYHKPEVPNPHQENAQALVLPGCFGALSEGGAALAVRKHNPDTKKEDRLKEDLDTTLVVNGFRVDAPFAVFKTMSTVVKKVRTAPSREHTKPSKPSVTETYPSPEVRKYHAPPSIRKQYT